MDASFEMLDFAFAAHETAASGFAGVGQDGKADSLPPHPGEVPSKAMHKKWAKKWRGDLSATKFGALIRGELPAEIKVLADRPVIVIADPNSPASATLVLPRTPRSRMPTR